MSHVLAVGILTAGIVFASFVTHPSSALASAAATAPSGVRRAASHAVTFDSNGAATQHVTDAATVGDFLRDQNIAVGALDYVDPAADVPLSDGLVVSYRAAVTVTILTAHQRFAATSAAQDVGALLEDQHVRLGSDDVVAPALADPVPANGVVRIERVVTWVRNEKHAIAASTVHRIDSSIAPGTSRTIAPGAPGERDVLVRFVQRDGGTVQKSVAASHVARKPRARVVADGVGEYQAFERFAAHGVARTAYIAQSAMEMVATAYTAGCAGCSGMTASGRRAGHGIVAVDPRVIPLGTRLFIPGYGPAVAGDTGGAIHGNRIDLGFNSLRDALLFGRRQVTVYRLK
ncbi:MAG: 3D domain-containing protein [Candidatus Tumulicola sp.]